MMTDELRMRALTSLEIGVQAPERGAVADSGKGGRILLVDDRPSSFERLAPVLSFGAYPSHTATRHNIYLPLPP
jgi:two-component system cell cycle response regulator